MTRIVRMQDCVLVPAGGVRFLIVLPRKYIEVSQVMPVPSGRLYERLLARCKSPNEVNSLHIALGNRLTPSEMESICHSDAILVLRAKAVAAWARCKLAASRAADRDYAWKLEMLHLAACSGREVSEPFLRRRLNQNMIFYSDRSESMNKTLIIGFTGYFHRMMVPTPSFLQCLPASRYDVLLLNDLARKGYAEGLPDVPGGFEGLVDAVQSFAERESYASVVSLGVSYGGVPALVIAARLGFDKGVSIGGIGRNRYRYSAVAMSRTLEKLQHSGPNLELVYGYDSRTDRKAAHSFADLASVRLLEVHSRSRKKIGHNVLHFLLLNKRLAMFFGTALDPSGHGFVGRNGEPLSILEI